MRLTTTVPVPDRRPQEALRQSYPEHTSWPTAPALNFSTSPVPIISIYILSHRQTCTALPRTKKMKLSKEGLKGSLPLCKSLEPPEYVWSTTGTHDRGTIKRPHPTHMLRFVLLP